MNKNSFFFLILFVSVFFVNAQKKYKTYKVKQGETLQSISKNLKIPSKDLMLLNPDIKNDVKANDIIVIPNLYYNKNKDIHNFEIDMVKGNDIIVDNFVYHEVLPKETLFRITTDYRVSSSDLKNHNPFLFTDGLKYGQILKIPLPKNNTISDSKLKPYVVKAKETKYHIAKKYGISIDSLEKINPQIKNGLQIDNIILVPKEEFVTNIHPTFDVIEAQKGETLYNLSKKYHVSQEELIKQNPELSLGVKEGMLIKIPNKIIKNESVYRDVIGEKNQIEMAIILPFQSNLKTLDFENNRLLNIATDFYFGTLVAIDSLKKQGVSVDVKVYDTQKSKEVTKKLANPYNFENTDVIIGPMFLDNLKVLANKMVRDSTLIVSPISEKDHSFLKKQNLVQAIPTDDQLTFEMLQYVKEQYVNQNIIIITDNNSDTKLNYITAALKQNDSIVNITVLKPKKGYIKPDEYKKAINENKENWVLLVGSDEVFIADAIHNYGVLPEDYKITVFSFDRNKNLDRIDNNFLARVNFHYPSHTYTDINDLQTKNFVSSYKRRFFTLPTKYSFKGFDETYDVLLRLTNDKNLTNQGVSSRICSKFNFIENTSGSIINQGVFILAYDGLNIKKVK